MPINSKNKGKRVELELVNLLKEWGDMARRTNQFCGYVEGDPDVDSVALSGYHLECKGVEKLNIDKAFAQSVRDSNAWAARNSQAPKIPVVVHKKNRGEFMVTLRLKDFYELARKRNPT